MKNVIHITRRALNEREAAHYIGLSPYTLRKARSEGPRKNHTAVPPHIKLGRSVRYLIDDLDLFLDRQRDYVPEAGW